MFRIDRASVGIRGDDKLTIPTRIVAVSEPQPEPDCAPSGSTAAIHEPPPGESPEEVFERASEQAARVLEQADNDAKHIVQQAYVQCDSIKNDAWQEGYRLGKEEGTKEARRLHAQELNALAALIEHIGALRGQIIDELERDVVALSLDIASKIVRRELSRSDEAYMNIVRGALRNLKSDGKVSVRVSPQEYERFFKDGSGRLGLNTETITVTAVADDTLRVGDLIIDSETGSINAGVETQLRAAEAALSQGVVS